MELLSVFNKYGERLDKCVSEDTKDDEFTDLERIGVAIIYIENSNGEYLVQKTSTLKGSRYSCTGGRISYMENPKDTIIREVKEELGLDISHDDIISLGFIIVDFPVRFIFYLKKDIDMNNFKLKGDEVESISFMNIEEIKELIKNGLMHKAHNAIIDKILEYKQNNL